MEFELRDHAKSGSGTSVPDPALSLQLGDETGAPGYHRDYPGISGWGWLDHQTLAADGDDYEDHPSDTKYVNPYDGVPGCCSDWNFTATALPEPGSLGLFSIGLGGVMFATRRRRLAK